MTLTFDLLTLNSRHSWLVTWQPRHQVWRPYAYPFLIWVITFPVGYYRKCVRGHCACAVSRDPWVGGQKLLHIWNCRPRFAYSQYNFYWAAMTIKGRLLSSVTNAKALDSVNILCVTLWHWPLTFCPWIVVEDGESLDQPCMRRITWPVSRGSKTITYLESPTPICLFTIQLP